MFHVTGCGSAIFTTGDSITAKLQRYIAFPKEHYSLFTMSQYNFSLIGFDLFTTPIQPFSHLSDVSNSFTDDLFNLF